MSADNTNTNIIKLKPIKLHSNSVVGQHLQESKTPHPSSLRSDAAGLTFENFLKANLHMPSIPSNSHGMNGTSAFHELFLNGKPNDFEHLKLASL